MMFINSKKKNLFCLVVISSLLLSGCDESKETIMEEETTAMFGKDKVVELKEQEKTKLELKHTEKINDMDIVLQSNYAIEKEQAEDWYFTKSSNIDLGLNIESMPENYKIVISQVYADISLLSPYGEYNGIRQDSINIEYFNLPNGGVSIDEKNGYNMPFQIEGVDKSETFFSMWQGTGRGKTERITEDDLVGVVEGAVLNVVWTILFESETGEQFIKTIQDKIGIPYTHGNTENKELTIKFKDPL